MKKCVVCGLEFKPNSNAQKYCKMCYPKHRREYKTQKADDYYYKHRPKDKNRRDKRKITIGWEKHQLGSPNPWNIYDYDLGYNYSGSYPQQISWWGRYSKIKVGMDTFYRDRYTKTAWSSCYQEAENGEVGVYDSTCILLGKSVKDEDNRFVCIDFTHKDTFKIAPRRIAEYNKLFGIVEDESAPSIGDKYRNWDYYSDMSRIPSIEGGEHSNLSTTSFYKIKEQLIFVPFFKQSKV